MNDRKTILLSALATGVLFFSTPLFVHGSFSFVDDGSRLHLLEKGEPVFAYNYESVKPPDALDNEQYERSSYIHPLYGVDGETLTEDFPADHLHHRGVFWAWPQFHVGDRHIDVWHLSGLRQHFARWNAREIRENSAKLAVQNDWILEDTNEAVVREEIVVEVYPAGDEGRYVDFHLTFTNIASGPITFRGQTGTGYGGLSVRMDGTRPDPAITTAAGATGDSNDLVTPWADFSSRKAPEGDFSGLAIFQHPENPEFPHSGWTLRHYGFIGPSWPHHNPQQFSPGESVELQYRLFIHRGAAEEANVEEHFERYMKEVG
ncbi:MAG: DUF6807 family protein [Opitutales bacterium]